MKSLFIVFSLVLCLSRSFAEEDCECTIYYSCDAANTVSSSTKCSGPEVCCKASPTRSPIVTAPVSKGTTERYEEENHENEGSSKKCECVPASECPEVSGAGQLDIRFGKSCPINQVCCPRSQGIGHGGGGGEGHPTGGDDEFQECGVRRSPNEQLTSFRITGNKGEKTDTFFAEFPWMVAVLTNRKNKDGSITENVFQCGASLILPNVVMTAAHCVQNEAVNDVKVRAGEWDTISDNDTYREPYPFIERTVNQILIHDKFEPVSVYNDIALLILDFPLPIKNHINQICTPNYAEEYDEHSCLVTGWGKDRFGDGKYQSTLRKVDLKIVDRDTCQKKLRKTRLGNAFQLHESFLCAVGGPNQDACKGDGGGPLVCQLKNDPKRYTQVGIVAWGIGCGSDTPGVYVDVFKFKKWILDNSHGQLIDTRIHRKP